MRICVVYFNVGDPLTSPLPGLPINIAALCWLIPIFIFTLFPPVVPTTPQTMNWACLLFGFILLFATFYYVIWGRKVYISPKERLRRDLQENK